MLPRSRVSTLHFGVFILESFSILNTHSSLE
jgi:hypothetical protein